MSELKLQRVPRMDLGPWIVTLALLAGSVAYARATAPAPREVHAFEGHVLFSLPAGWSFSENQLASDDDTHTVFVAQQPSLNSIHPTVLVEPVDVEGSADALFIDLEVTRMQEARAESGVGYRVLHVDERDAVGGHKSTWVWYAIVRDPPDSEPGAAVYPIVVVGVDVLVVTEDGAWHIAAFEPLHESPDDEGHLRSIVEGLRIRR